MARRAGTPRRLRERGGAFREPLLSDADFSAATRPDRYRGPRARRAQRCGQGARLAAGARRLRRRDRSRSEEHTSELQSLMRISYAVFCLKKKNTSINNNKHTTQYQHDTKIASTTPTTQS